MNTRVAIYVRVSKKDGSQDVANQLHHLQSYAGLRGWHIVGIYQDEESGRKGRGERSQFDQMFKDAARRAFEVVLFWSLDRFSREGVAQTLHYLRQLEEVGVRFHSLQEEFLNTDSELVRPIILAIFAHLAAYEASRISARTKAGLERAVRAGKQLGRPNRQVAYRETVEQLWANHWSVPAIVRQLRCAISESTVRRIIAAAQQAKESPHTGGDDP